jgi:hypothetical protein
VGHIPSAGKNKHGMITEVFEVLIQRLGNVTFVEAVDEGNILIYSVFSLLFFVSPPYIKLQFMNSKFFST